MIHMLVQRCGAALADVSAEPRSARPNLNVIHEIGISAGAANLTFLLRDPRPVALPSNFTGLPIARYNPRARDYPEGQARRIAPMLREINAIWLSTGAAR
jgi:hypothetical protein